MIPFDPKLVFVTVDPTPPRTNAVYEFTAQVARHLNDMSAMIGTKVGIRDPQELAAWALSFETKRLMLEIDEFNRLCEQPLPMNRSIDVMLFASVSVELNRLKQMGYV